jgi:hypothetical protein
MFLKLTLYAILAIVSRAALKSDITVRTVSLAAQMFYLFICNTKPHLSELSALLLKCSIYLYVT